ncbi:MAG: hypothetical protein JO247_14135, partial [Chloroflexi bacterium]|nr:hypothetical protein [Chloroflexota bacterium]
RLMPTTAATTIRKDQDPPLVIDGPFAETKEQLLGFYVVECAGLDQALETARELDRELAAGQYRGVLHGIPIVHKDLYYTKGVRTTAGSKILGNFVPEEDAFAVAKLREAGTVMLGKVSMEEFALGGSNENLHYGAVHNPWNLDCVPGGSSGGSAAALAAGFCLAATGSDTAASIRHPASFCGVTGMKPTYGRVSLYGIVPLTYSVDCPGPLARSVRDLAFLLQAMAGYDWRDAASEDRPVPDFTAELEAGLRGLRIGVPGTYFNEQVQADVWDAYQGALRVLHGLGAETVAVRFETLGPNPRRGSSESALFHEQWLRERPGDYDPRIRAGFERGLDVTGLEMAAGLRWRERLTVEMRRIFQECDVLATPTVPVTASRIGVDEVDMNGEGVPRAGHWVRFTQPFNAAHLPASSQPCGFDRDGMPIGLQLSAPWWQEARILRVAAAYEGATDWHRRRAPLE